MRNCTQGKKVKLNYFNSANFSNMFVFTVFGMKSHHRVLESTLFILDRVYLKKFIWNLLLTKVNFGKLHILRTICYN